MRNALGLACAFVLLSGCADACGGERAAKKPAAAEPAAEKEAPAPATPTATAWPPIVPWESFKQFAPDTLADYHAVANASGRIFTLAGNAQLSSLQRRYEKGETKLDFEMHDAVQTPATRTMFDHARKQPRETPEAITRAIEVQGHEALAQWMKVTKTARVSVIVNNRFVVNIALKPVMSPDEAIALVEKLDYMGLTALAPAAPPPQAK